MHTITKKTSVKKDKNTFFVSEMIEDGKSYLLRFKNNLWKLAESGNYPYQIGIAVPLLTGQNGFPNKEENDQLLVLERNLENEFEQGGTAVFAGVILGDRVKEFVFYTGKPKEAQEICEDQRKKIKHHELQCMIREDSNWEVYKTYGPKNNK